MRILEEKQDRLNFSTVALASPFILLLADSFYIMHLWNWFISPVTNLTEINAAQALGISFCWSIFNSIYGNQSIINNEQENKNLFEGRLKALIIFGFAWLFHFFHTGSASL